MQKRMEENGRKSGVLKKGGAMLGTILLAMLALSGCRKADTAPEQQVYVMAGESLRLQKESQLPEQEELPGQEEFSERRESLEQEELLGRRESLEQEKSLKQEEALEEKGLPGDKERNKNGKETGEGASQPRQDKAPESKTPEDTASALEEETTAVYVCALEEDEIRITDTITLIARGDRVIRMKDAVEIDLTAFDDEMNEIFAEMFAELQEEFAGMEGVTCQATSGEKIYTLELFVEVEGKSAEELAEEGLLTIGGDGEEVSLEEAGRLLIESGYERAEEI